MPQINIPEPKRYSYERTLEDQIAVLDAKLKVSEARCNAAESLIEAIFENIAEGKECYLQYRDGKIIYIVDRDRSQASGG